MPGGHMGGEGKGSTVRPLPMPGGLEGSGLEGSESEPDAVVAGA